MSDLLVAEMLKLRKRPMTWVLAVSMVAVLASVYAILAAGAGAGDPESKGVRDWEASLAFANTVTFGDAIVFRLVALMGIILAGVSVSGEYRWRTIVTQCGWTGERVRPLAARAGACLAFAIGGLILCHVALVVISAVTAAVRGDLASSDIGWWLAGDSALAAVRGVLPVAIYVALAVAVATWTRSGAAAVAVPLAVLLLEPLGSALLASGGGAVEAASRLTLSRNIDALLAANGAIRGTDNSIPDGLPSAWAGALFLAGFIAVTFVLTARTFAKRDITD